MVDIVQEHAQRSLLHDMPHLQGWTCLHLPCWPPRQRAWASPCCLLRELPLKVLTRLCRQSCIRWCVSWALKSLQIGGTVGGQCAEACLY